MIGISFLGSRYATPVLHESKRQQDPNSIRKGFALPINIRENNLSLTRIESGINIYFLNAFLEILPVILRVIRCQKFGTRGQFCGLVKLSPPSLLLDRGKGGRRFASGGSPSFGPTHFEQPNQETGEVDRPFLV